MPNIHFVYVDLPKWMRFWKKKARGLHFYYLLWQIGAYWIAKKLHRQEQFDAVHHLTFGNLWLPTFMPFLQVPFIWGPIGGGEQVPKIFRKEYYFKSKLKENIRDIVINFLKVNLLFLYICRKAQIIIAKTSLTANRIPALYQSKVFITTDVAKDKENRKAIVKNDNDLNIIAVGRLDPWRGFDLLIKAFSKIAKEDEKIKLLIMGEGVDRKRLHKICDSLHLNNRVSFLGHMNREKYLDYMSTSSIFANPCLKEGGVTVLFDALTFGLPVICLDVPGAAEIISDVYGIKIKPITPEQTGNDLGDAIFRLANDPEIRKRMGEAGRKRMMELYTWEKKGELIRSLYQSIVTKEDPFDS